MELEWLVSWHVHEGNKSKDFKAIFFWLLLFQYFIHSVYFLNECYTNFKFHGIHLLHRINPYCTVFGSHLLHRMHPYYTVIGSHLLHIINPWLHWFWFNFTLYYLYLASDYTISDYTVFQKYSIQCIPGSCCIPVNCWAALCRIYPQAENPCKSKQKIDCVESRILKRCSLLDFSGFKKALMKI